MGRSVRQVPDDSIRSQVVWYLFLRVIFISLFLGGTIFFQTRIQFAATEIQLTCLYLLFGVSYLEALASAAFLATIKHWTQFILVQLIWDLCFATALIVITGGVESPFSFLYILVILVASSFFALREILVIAAVAAILFGGVLDLQFYGYWPSILISPGRITVEPRQVMFSVFLNLTAFLLSAVLAGIFASRLRRSQQELVQQLIDFEELERMNRAISACTPSGLMLINTEGRIRSFNRAAEKITGYSLQQVYDRDVREMFPYLFVLDAGAFRVVQHDDVEIVNRQGELRILGYSSSLVQITPEQSSELLISFEDLTDFKQMEERLNRADRLAAVGKLASGLAHEIRNPLASISGSVQLLMESASLHADDRHLMNIVVREADRLGRLLGDFLSFARPAQPHCQSVNLNELICEITQMLCRDQRFAQIIVVNKINSQVCWSADEAQLRQVLWNLFSNAAEAMPSGGKVIVGIETRAGNEFFYIEDEGPGIPAELREKIFDPFFTTKDHGSGLGLSITYTIVAAHNAEIHLQSTSQGGARFEIFWPKA